MKKLLLLVVLMIIPTILHAEPVSLTFSWQYNAPEEQVEAYVIYELFETDGVKSRNEVGRVPASVNEFTYTQTNDTLPHSYACVATKEGVKDSEYSEVVTWYPPNEIPDLSTGMLNGSFEGTFQVKLN